MNKLYKGKRFYIKNPDGSLNGPREDIYYSARHFHSIKERLTYLVKNIIGKDDSYKFCQVVDGQIVQAFRKNEILVIQE